MAPKRPAPKGPKLMHSYTPLIGPESWLSTMGKMQMSSTSTSVFYPLPLPHICLLRGYWLCICTVRCCTENVIDRASTHCYPLKLQLGLISMHAHRPNFWTRLYDILGSITFSSCIWYDRKSAVASVQQATPPNRHQPVIFYTDDNCK